MAIAKTPSELNRKDRIKQYLDNIPSIQKYRRQNATDFEDEWDHTFTDDDIVEYFDSDLLERNYGKYLSTIKPENFDPFFYAHKFDNSREGQKALNNFERGMTKGSYASYYDNLKRVANEMSNKNSLGITEGELASLINHMKGYY